MKTTNERLAALILLLGSNRDGEVVGAARAIQRVLKANGQDLHQLADTVARNGNTLSEAEMQKLYNAGFEAELKLGESRRNVSIFHNVGEPDWNAMALWCHDRSDRLERRHRTFIEGMVELTGENEELSVRQRNYLRSLYHRLGGR